MDAPAHSDAMQTAQFVDALEGGDLAGVRAVPKADLHVHAFLGGCRAFIRERTGQDIKPLKRVLASIDEMHAWNHEHLAPIFNIPGRHALPYEATFAQCRRDGVVRIDMGVDAGVMARDGASAKAVWEWLKAIYLREGTAVDWLPQLGFMRHHPRRLVESWVAPLLELGVFRTFDMYGDELAQPIEVFAPIYRQAKAAGLTLKCHVGEWGTADDVWRAVELLELDEVQHGIAAAQSPQVMRFLSDTGVRLNLCPTSNLMLGRVARIEDHPIRALYDAGVRVTVNTDDPLMLGSDLSEEFLLLRGSGLMSAAELDAIRREALDG